MMQPQGLGALMPQGAQQAPQMNNPRLNAAVDVVSSDAEKQILDPRTLAMLKYKDALQAMQAADQMMAAAQPQPMPPTVAERTKLAAEQGIAGLASRLSPGIQRQGGNMQAQQLQQAVSGGLPQLSAPNMAGMAGGGIVAFQEGGRPEDKFLFTDEFGNPVYESDLARMDNAGAIDETPEGIERRARNEALREKGQQSLADIFGATRAPIEIAPAAQESAVEPRGRGGYGLDEMFIDAKGGIASLINRAGPAVSGLMQDLRPITPEAYQAEEEAKATAATPTAAQGRPVVPRQVQPAQQGFTPAPESMSGGMREPTPVERLRAAAAENTAQLGGQDAVDAVLEAEAQPRAGESASDQAARRRMLIAGLRGFGAQGLGGFAAGTAEEELRAEQEGIAEQERQRRAAMETRGFDLQQQELTLMDQLRREDAKDRRFNQVMSLVANFQQLADNDRFRLGSAITDATADVTSRLGMLDQAIASPNTGRKERESYEGQRNVLAGELDRIVRGVTESFGQGMDYRPIVEALLRSAMPAGMGATATTISPATLAALEQYGTQ
jgi:hypothetical protein